ncbi:MAG: CehA/McbA family metallohydrolase [Planctomycetes bacterium]|nr:CehA/McbA family metallohydrolase [Planctomycetota bacterium]
MASGKLIGTIVHAGSGRAIPARLYVTGSDSQRYYPKPSLAHPIKRDLEGHVITTGQPFEVELPTGLAHVRIERGPEFHPLAEKVDIPAQGVVEKRFELRRWVDLADLGWYSGELHVHRRLADMHTLLLGEDVNVAMPITAWDGRRDPDLEMFAQHATPGGEVRVDDKHLFTIFNQEYEPARSPTGAVLLMGMNQIIEGQSAPPLGPLFDIAHERGGFVDMEKHSWAWAPVVAAAGKCDVFELANNHHWREKCLYIDFEVAARSLKAEYPETIEGWTLYGFDSYYAYLNCGFRMAPAAGTANGVHPNPFGHNRVYVSPLPSGERGGGEGSRRGVATPEPLGAKSWQRALLAGRSFVTNGPILFLEAGGEQPGGEIRAAGPTRIAGRLRLQSLTKPERVELVRGGDVVQSFRSDPNPAADGVYRSDFQFEVPVDDTTYLTARAFVEPPDRTTIRFAHTGIIRITVPPGAPGLRPRRFEVEHFVRRVESMIAEIREGKLRSGDAGQVLAEYERALSVYRQLLTKSR